MDPVDAATLVEGKGVQGSASFGSHRQVTIIALERWLAMMAELGADVDPSARRAELMVSGLDLERAATGWSTWDLPAAHRRGSQAVRADGRSVSRPARGHGPAVGRRRLGGGAARRRHRGRRRRSWHGELFSE